MTDQLDDLLRAHGAVVRSVESPPSLDAMTGVAMSGRDVHRRRALLTAGVAGVAVVALTAVLVAVYRGPADTHRGGSGAGSPSPVSSSPSTGGLSAAELALARRLAQQRADALLDGEANGSTWPRGLISAYVSAMAGRKAESYVSPPRAENVVLPRRVLVVTLAGPFSIVHGAPGCGNAACPSFSYAPAGGVTFAVDPTTGMFLAQVVTYGGPPGPLPGAVLLYRK